MIMCELSPIFTTSKFLERAPLKWVADGSVGLMLRKDLAYDGGSDSTPGEWALRG